MKFAMILGAALALSVPAAAHEPDEKRVKKIVMIHKDGTKRDIDLDRIHATAVECLKDNQFESDYETEVDGKKQRSTIILCHKGEGDRLATLEKARARLAEGDEFRVDPRSRALAALDAEIARLKAAE